MIEEEKPTRGRVPSLADRTKENTRDCKYHICVLVAIGTFILGLMLG